MTLWVDDYEPKEMVSLLKQSVNTVHAPLNHQGFADYMWFDAKQHRRQWERKQLIEYLGDMDGTEEQLNNHLSMCDELTLVIEGWGEPDAQGVQVYQKRGKGYMPSFHFPPQKLLDSKQAKARPGLWTEYEGRKNGLRSQGVQVIETRDLIGTAMALAAAYSGSMKEEHTTFKRYLIPHVPPFSPDIHVDNLARLKGTRVGLVKAQAAIDRFHTLYNVVTAEKAALELTWDKGTAKTFCDTIGRK